VAFIRTDAEAPGFLDLPARPLQLRGAAGEHHLAAFSVVAVDAFLGGHRAHLVYGVHELGAKTLFCLRTVEADKLRR
jgi:hypothetical protein